MKKKTEKNVSSIFKLIKVNFKGIFMFFIIEVHHCDLIVIDNQIKTCWNPRKSSKAKREECREVHFSCVVC